MKPQDIKNMNKTFEDTMKLIHNSVTSTLRSEAEFCEHCDGTGKVKVGEFENIEERNCTLCNRKESVEEQMDDNS